MLHAMAAEALLGGGKGPLGGKSASGDHHVREDFDDKNLGGGDGGLDEDNGDDPVVREVPVYLSDQLAQELHVIQYPNRPFFRPYELPAAARMKSRNKLLELEYFLPQHSPHIDEDAPRHLRLDRIKVQSSYLDPMTTYAVGALRDGALHLTPLAGIFQMRASSEHADAAPEDREDDVLERVLLAERNGRRMEEGGDATESEGVGPSKATASSASTGGGEGAPPIKLRHIEYKKRESEKAAAARRTSYAFKKQQEEGEPWRELLVHPLSSQTGQTDLERMFCTREEDMGRKIKFQGGGTIYLDLYRSQKSKAAARERGEGLSRMIDHQQQHSAAFLDAGMDAGDGVIDGDETAVKANLSSLAVGNRAPRDPSIGALIPHMQGAEQVATILARAHVVSFEQVLELSGGNGSWPPHGCATTPEGVDHATGSAVSVLALERLKKCAVLVRGNWVRKSILYGLSARLSHARDALLLLLDRYGGVNRQQFGAAAGLSDEESRGLLSPIATLDKAARMWVMLPPDDIIFLTAFPEVALQQQRLWREMERETTVLSILQTLGGKPDCPFPGPVVVASGTGTEREASKGGGGGRGGGKRMARAGNGVVSMEIDEKAESMCRGEGGGGIGKGKTK